MYGLWYGAASWCNMLVLIGHLYAYRLCTSMADSQTMWSVFYIITWILDDCVLVCMTSGSVWCDINIATIGGHSLLQFLIAWVGRQFAHVWKCMFHTVYFSSCLLEVSNFFLIGRRFVCLWWEEAVCCGDHSSERQCGAVWSSVEGLVTCVTCGDFLPVFACCVWDTCCLGFPSLLPLSCVTYQRLLQQIREVARHFVGFPLSQRAFLWNWSGCLVI